MRKTLTPADSPYTIPFATDSGVLCDEAVNLDVSGAVTVVFPAISTLGGTLNQKVCLTNISDDAAITCQPASSDTFCGNGTGINLVAPTGFGKALRFQPATDIVWSYDGCAQV